MRKVFIVLAAALVAGALTSASITPAGAAPGPFPRQNDPLICNFQYDVDYYYPPPNEYYGFSASGSCYSVLQLKSFSASLTGRVTTDATGCPTVLDSTMALSDNAFSVVYYRLPSTGNGVAVAPSGSPIQLLLDLNYRINSITNTPGGPSTPSALGVAVGTVQTNCNPTGTDSFDVSMLAVLLAPPPGPVYSIFDPPPAP